MMMPREDILTILAQNIAIRGSAFPLNTTRLTEWSKGLGLPKGGKTVLFTGHMYQMMPYLKGLQKRQANWPFLFKGTALARLLNPIINLTGFITLGAATIEDKRFYYGVLRNIVQLLRQCDIEFGYLYEREDYAGALAYDLGLDRVFERHARRVYKKLKEYGVATIITVDPHTTDILKNVYPQVIDNFDIEVKNYLQLLAEHWHKVAKKPNNERVVIHDSCVYARHLSMVEEPRHLFQAVGISIIEPYFSGKNTHCCGGPIESLYPEKAREIAKNRMDQLTGLESDTIVTMCPICHINLVHGAGKQRVTDISHILIQKKEA